MSRPVPEHAPPELPRQVVTDPRYRAVVEALERQRVPLEPDGEHEVAEVALCPSLASALRAANEDGVLVRGLEATERRLRSEAQGMAKSDARSGAERGARVSRVLIIANDGSRRFYRNVSFAWRHHASRVLVVRVQADQDALGQAAFGDGAQARAALVTHKVAVANVLFALTG